MDADTTSAPDDGSGNRQPEEAVSSTTEDDRPVVSAADGYEVEGDYYGNEGICTTSLEDLRRIPLNVQAISAKNIYQKTTHSTVTF